MRSGINMKGLRKTARRARQKIDQTLLGLEHSKASQMVADLKGEVAASGDIVTRIGQNVLARAKKMRKSLVGSVVKTIESGITTTASQTRESFKKTRVIRKKPKKSK